MSRPKNDILSNDTARNLAVNSLLAFSSDGAYIQDSLNRLFQKADLPVRDKRLATELALGSCRQLITLDHLIGAHSDRQIRRIEPTVREILRVALYQLIYLSGVPDWAAVNEAVQQAKDYRGPGAANFVNAILRSVQREIVGPVAGDSDAPVRATIWLDWQQGLQFKSDFLPDPGRQPVKYFSVAFSHPPWLVERWLNRFDEPTVRAICRANNSRPPLILRANRLRCGIGELMERFTAAGIEVRQYGQALQLGQTALPDQLPGYSEGFFAVQDAAAMAVAPQLQPQPGQRILDLCAAPGGKTTHLAELMDNQGQIIACDTSTEKLELIHQNCQRLGITIVQTHLAEELEDVVRTGGPFDAVLADVPCSNTGVLARRVEVRHLLTPKGIATLARKQLELLHQAAAVVGPKGTILYSTCSIEPVENELLIQKFLGEGASFNLVRQNLLLPGGLTCASVTARQATIAHEGGWHDGAYTALLQRR